MSEKTTNAFHTRLTFAGVLLVALSLVIFGCSTDDDDGGGGGGSGGGVTQVDRMAVPGVNTALISSPLKNTYNADDPANDVTNYETEIETNITNLRTAVAGVLGAEDAPGISAAALTDVVNPDVVTISFANPVQFPNGRQLDDDVMDAVLGLVLNRGDALGGGGGVSDAIDNNDVAFLATFPYLATPNP